MNHPIIRCLDNQVSVDSNVAAEKLISEEKHIFAYHKRKQEYLPSIIEVSCITGSHIKKRNHHIRKQRSWYAQEMERLSSALKQPRGRSAALYKMCLLKKRNSSFP